MKVGMLKSIEMQIFTPLYYGPDILNGIISLCKTYIKVFAVAIIYHNTLSNWLLEVLACQLVSNGNQWNIRAYWTGDMKHGMVAMLLLAKVDVTHYTLGTETAQ